MLCQSLPRLKDGFSSERALVPHTFAEHVQKVLLRAKAGGGALGVSCVTDDAFKGLAEEYADGGDDSTAENPRLAS